MAVFRIELKYFGNSKEEIVEIRADTVGDAKKICERLMDENLAMMEHLRRFNIYSSRILESCKMCPCGFKMDMLACDGVKKSIDDI